MIKTIIGLILLGSPFLLSYKWEDNKSAFVSILSFLIAFHLFIAVLTQALHVFTYPVIAMIHAIVFWGILVNININKIFILRRRISSAGGGKGKDKRKGNGISSWGWGNISKIDWMFAIVLIIGFIYLYPVHYNYSGKYSVVTTPQYQVAENMRYPYPYFSDEWYAIALIKYSITSHALPFVNPLVLEQPSETYSPFINLEFAFHSFLSELILLLGLDPLTDYTRLTIFTGLLICVLVYMFLRYDGVDKFPAAIAALSILYITNGANLPGIWTLIPLIMGIISMLLGFFFILSDNKKMMFLSGFITLLFYPPLFPFYILKIILFFLTAERLSFGEKVRDILYFLMMIAVVGIILSISCFLARGAFERLFQDVLLPKVFPPTFTPGAIPRFLIWNIIPVPILFLSGLGIFPIIKRRIWLVGMLVIGIAYWAFYSFVEFRFILTFERVVVLTAILIILLSGYGLNFLIETFKRFDFFRRNYSLSYIQAGVLMLFLFLSARYTNRDNWRQLELYHLETGQTLPPAAPANNYLQPDDLRIFRNIKNKRFLSLPWKGTVIGVSTDNYSFAAKPGTLSGEDRQIDRYIELLYNKKKCKQLYKKMRQHGIEYLYVPRFTCPNFEVIDKSSEGLYLYRVEEIH